MYNYLKILILISDNRLIIQLFLIKNNSTEKKLLKNSININLRGVAIIDYKQMFHLQLKKF